MEKIPHFSRRRASASNDSGQAMPELLLLATSFVWVGVYGSVALILSMIGGAFAGSIIGLWFHAPLNTQDAIFRGVGGVLMAAVLTPLVLRWSGWPMEPDVVVGISAAVAALAWFFVIAFREIDPRRVGRALLEAVVSIILRSRK